MIALLIAIGALGMPLAPASAARMSFGTDEHLNKIADIDLKGSKGESLYLGYKLSFHAFGLPYRVTDDGYILGVAGEPRRYFPLNADLIESLQAQGRLPRPLPAYSISTVDYLMGNLAWLVLAGIGASLLFSWRGQRRRKQAVPLAQAGLDHHRAGNLDAAITEYDKALAIDPRIADVLMLRGDAYRARGDVDRAISDYSKIVKHNAKNALALLARGAAFESKGLAARAMDDFTRAIKASKASVAYLMRADLHLKSDNPAAAIKDYTAALDKNDELAAAYQGRAKAYERMGKPDLAAADQAAAARIVAAAGQPA